jgi:hypothetical protein
MSKMRDLSMFYAIAAMMGDRLPKVPDVVRNQSIQKPKPVPKGCKEYFFNQDGEFSTTKMLKSECVFKCVAINDKTAIEKFKAFQQLKPHKP